MHRTVEPQPGSAASTDCCEPVLLCQQTKRSRHDMRLGPSLRFGGRADSMERFAPMCVDRCSTLRPHRGSAAEPYGRMAATTLQHKLSPAMRECMALNGFATSPCAHQGRSAPLYSKSAHSRMGDRSICRSGCVTPPAHESSSPTHPKAKRSAGTSDPCVDGPSRSCRRWDVDSTRGILGRMPRRYRSKRVLD